MATPRSRRPTTHGAHSLVPWAVRRVLDAIEVKPGEVVVDLGAGIGNLTVELARLGCRVIAVEQHARTVAALRRRVADHDVLVIHGDMRDFRWPQRPFRVVANPPFGLSTWLIQQLTEHRPRSLRGADLVLQRGFVRQLAEPARDGRTARWQRAAQLEEALRLPSVAFSPPPKVGASLLRLRPRR